MSGHQQWVITVELSKSVCLVVIIKELGVSGWAIGHIAHMCWGDQQYWECIWASVPSNRSYCSHVLRGSALLGMYHSAFPTTHQYSLLPFMFTYYTPPFTATIQHSLLHSSIHCYHSAFPTTLQYSLLPCSISFYILASTTNIQHSLLHSSIDCYPSAFSTTCQHWLLSFSIPYNTPAFTATI